MERVFKLKKDKVDERDFIYKGISASVEVPEKADLRRFMPTVFDQGNLGSCTANAWTAFTMYSYFIKEGQMPTYLSRLDHYWHERDLEGTVNEDAGAFLRDGGKVLVNRGVAPEGDWPYDVSKFAVQPPAELDVRAARYKITEYHRVTSLTSLKQAIGVDLLPVVIGIQVYPSFMTNEVAASGFVPMPDRTKETPMGGHAVLVVGYDDTRKVVIVRNSWGVEWGDKGYFYLPYSYIQDGGLTNDLWTGTLVKSTPTPPPAPPEMTVSEAVDLFASKGILDSPDFWKNLGTKYANDPTSDFRFVGLAFIKLAKYIKG